MSITTRLRDRVWANGASRIWGRRVAPRVWCRVGNSIRAVPRLSGLRGAL